ncbi:TPA: hypothetical protein JAN03_14935 [Citrobacter freundii]|nr:hypothetical protein [Citrobacter freundii]
MKKMINVNMFIERHKHIPDSFKKFPKGNQRPDWEDNIYYFEGVNKKRSIIALYDTYLCKSHNYRSYERYKHLINIHPLSDEIKSLAKSLIISRYNDLTLRGRMFKPISHCKPLIMFLSWVYNNSIHISEFSLVDFKKFSVYLRSKNIKETSLEWFIGEILWYIRKLQTAHIIPLSLVFTQKSVIKKELKKSKKYKMPDDDCIAAALSVFHETYPSKKDLTDENIFNIRFVNSRARYVASMVILMLAATQRFAAEGVYLANDMLIKRNSSNKQYVYSYIFNGSKRFPVNQKHILSCLYPFVERVLEYCRVAYEPARILARFYENPTIPSKELLVNINITDTYNLDLEKPINLFQLAGLLNIYDTYPDKCRSFLYKIPGFPFSLEMDVTYNTKSYNTYWFGIVARNKQIPQLDATLSPRQLQDVWIYHIKKSLPNFPFRHHNNGTKVHISDCLSCLTGFQAQTSTRGSYPYSTSPLAIESVSLDNLVYNDLKGRYFKMNGFNSNFSITPHQFRHYNNTVYLRSGVSDSHLAILSGRVSVNQNAEYDHRSDQAVAYKLNRFINSDKDTSFIADNIIDARQFRMLSGRAASDTGVGLCLQDLSQTPCMHLSDFKHHCVNCTKAAFCKGNAKSISKMKEDADKFSAHLEDIVRSCHLSHNSLLQKHFIVNNENLCYYRELISIMQDNTIADGCLIKPSFISHKKITFEIFDLSRSISPFIVERDLPDFTELLRIALHSKKADKDCTPGKLESFLKDHGVNPLW